MDGLNDANYRGLEKLLKQKPADADSWTFARGQALLIAETGNLLLLRPPRNAGQDAWFRDAMDLRDAASDLARKVGDRDYEGSVAGLKTVAVACNNCHHTFRVSTQVGGDDKSRAALPRSPVPLFPNRPLRVYSIKRPACGAGTRDRLPCSRSPTISMWSSSAPAMPASRRPSPPPAWGCAPPC